MNHCPGAGFLSMGLHICVYIPTQLIQLIINILSSCGLTRFWTIMTLCRLRSCTAALTSGMMPRTHSCISHSRATNVPDRPTPALREIPAAFKRCNRHREIQTAFKRGVIGTHALYRDIVSTEIQISANIKEPPQ